MGTAGAEHSVVAKKRPRKAWSEGSALFGLAVVETTQVGVKQRRDTTASLWLEQEEPYESRDSCTDL